MSFEFETKMLKLASERRRILQAGEKLIKAERKKLDIEKYFNIDILCKPDIRAQAINDLGSYKKQLIVEKNFYSEFHESYIRDIEDLTGNLTTKEREKLLARSLTGLQENHSIRMTANQEKTLATDKLERIIEIFDHNNVREIDSEEHILLENEADISEVEKLQQEIDAHLETQHRLTMLQRKRGVDGQRFIERFFNILRTN